MSAVDELTTPLTREEIEAAIYAAIEAYGVSTSGWKPGAVTRTVIAAVSIALASLSTLQAQLARLGFLRLSHGTWLEAVARNVYGVEKIHGTFATGPVTLSNAGGGVFTVDVGDLVVIDSGTGKAYRNIEAFSLNAFETGKQVTVRAIERGTASNALAGGIDAIQTTMLGVTVTNEAALVGQDEESDAQLIQRCLGKIAALSPNGPKDAYRFVAFDAKTDDGTPAGVTRATTSADGLGGVDMVVATASGTLDGALGDTTTPLGAVEAAVHQLAEPLAITARVASATPLLIPFQYTVHMRSGSRTPNEVRDAINAAAALRVGIQPIGGSRIAPGPGYVFTDFLEAVISQVVGTDDLLDLTLVEPPADIVVGASEAPVLGVPAGTVVAVSE